VVAPRGRLFSGMAFTVTDAEDGRNQRATDPERLDQLDPRSRSAHFEAIDTEIEVGVDAIVHARDGFRKRSVR
jgi:hypothetical protein